MDSTFEGHVESTAYMKFCRTKANAILLHKWSASHIFHVTSFHDIYTECINASMICCTGDTFVRAGCALMSSTSREVYCFLWDRAIFFFPFRTGALRSLSPYVFFVLCATLIFVLLTDVAMCASNFCRVVRSLRSTSPANASSAVA